MWEAYSWTNINIKNIQEEPEICFEEWMVLCSGYKPDEKETNDGKSLRDSPVIHYVSAVRKVEVTYLWFFGSKIGRFLHNSSIVRHVPEVKKKRPDSKENHKKKKYKLYHLILQYCLLLSV